MRIPASGGEIPARDDRRMVMNLSQPWRLWKAFVLGASFGALTIIFHPSFNSAEVVPLVWTAAATGLVFVLFAAVRNYWLAGR
jgi:hypothetical protein